MAYSNTGVSGVVSGTAKAGLRMPLNDSQLWQQSTILTPKISYTETYDIEGNKSQVVLKVFFSAVENGYSYAGNVYIGSNSPEATSTSGLYVNGSLVRSMSYYTGNDRIVIANGKDCPYLRNGVEYSYTFEVPHNIDGSGSITVELRSIGGSGNNDIYMYQVNGMALATTTIYLTTIPRASKITASNVQIGSQTAVNFTRYSSAFTDSLYYKIEGETAENLISTGITTNSYAWTVPTSLLSKLSATSTSLKITLISKTYKGSTFIGSNTCQITVTATNEQLKPTVSLAYELYNDYSALTGNNTTLILNASNVRFIATATAKEGATIANYSFTNTPRQSGNITTNIYEVRPTRNQNASVVVTDSRGVSNTATITMPYVNWNNPTIQMEATNPDSQTNETFVKITGTWYPVNFGAQENSLTVKVRYKETYAQEFGEWIELTNIGEGRAVEATTTLILDYSKKWEIQTSIEDKLQEVTASQTVTTIPIFDWGENDFNFNVIATGEKPPKGDSSRKIPTTEWVMENRGGTYSGVKNITLNDTKSGNIKIYKVGNICTMAYDFTMNVSGADTVIGTLPEGFRPKMPLTFVVAPWATHANNTRYIILFDDGRISCFDASPIRLLGVITYAVE